MTNELYHIGVLGMKWGVHRSRSAKYAEKSGKVTRRIRKREEKAHPIKKDLADLSDYDLQTRIDRMYLEKRYSELLESSSPRRQSQAFKLIERIGFNTLDKVGTAYATHTISKALTKIDPTFKYSPSKKKG